MVVSYSEEKTPPRGLRSVCALRFPANHLAQRKGGVE